MDFNLPINGFQVFDFPLGCKGSFVQENDVLAHSLDVVHEVAGHQNRPVCIVDHGVERGDHEFSRFHVESVGRLIGDEQVGVVDDGAWFVACFMPVEKLPISRSAVRPCQRIAGLHGRDS